MAFQIRVQKKAWDEEGRVGPAPGSVIRMPPEFSQMVSGEPITTDFHVVLDLEDDGDFWVVRTRLAHPWETGESQHFTPYAD
jgi:hypothetical protein